MTPTNAELHQLLITRYDLEGLKTLCVYLDIDPDSLEHGTKDVLARELIRYMGRQNRSAELVAMYTQAEAALARRRPQENRATAAYDPRRVFISHAHQDTALAHRLATDLERAGWLVWIAPESIRPGEQWLPAIARGLQESGVCVVIMTPDGVASSWVEYETNLAISRERRRQMRLLFLDAAPCDPPFQWTGYQFLPMRNHDESGVAGLLRWLDGAPVAAERPPDPAPPRAGILLPPGTVAHPSRPGACIHEKSGIEFVRVPAGPFLYGSAGSDSMAYDNEKPQRTIDLPEYWIGRAPVTNTQYKRFLDANPKHRAPSGWNDREPPAGRQDHPVVNISWHDAQAFCDWAGLALPSEEQWEKAARGTDGRLWPWGNAEPAAGHCNFNRNVGSTTPAGHYSPVGDSPYGCVDMAGNVWEWAASWFDTSQTLRVLRGGSWYTDARACRCALRGRTYPSSGFDDRGLRALVAPS